MESNCYLTSKKKKKKGKKLNFCLLLSPSLRSKSWTTYFQRKTSSSNTKIMCNWYWGRESNSERAIYCTKTHKTHMSWKVKWTRWCKFTERSNHQVYHGGKKVLDSGLQTSLAHLCEDICNFPFLFLEGKTQAGSARTPTFGKTTTVPDTPLSWKEIAFKTQVRLSLHCPSGSSNPTLFPQNAGFQTSPEQLL